MSDFYTCHQDEEVFTCEDVDSAVLKFLDNCAKEYWPETVTVYGYSRKKLPEISTVVEEVLDHVLDWLDNDCEYNGSDDYSEPTPKMKEAAEALAKVILEEYEVWTCELSGETETVNVMDWIKKNCPDWLEK